MPHEVIRPAIGALLAFDHLVTTVTEIIRNFHSRILQPSVNKLIMRHLLYPFKRVPLFFKRQADAARH
jgi:hypothetical protein